MLDDLIAPVHPKMPLVSKEIFMSARYVVTLTNFGLIVQRHGNGTGVNLPKTHPQFSDFVAAFCDLMDEREGNDLCKSLL